MNPSARAYVWNLQPCEWFIAPAEDGSVTTISGWSEGLLGLIPRWEAAPGAQVAEVEAMRC